jgi:hypothetical protein
MLSENERDCEVGVKMGEASWSAKSPVLCACACACVLFLPVKLSLSELPHFCSALAALGVGRGRKEF